MPNHSDIGKIPSPGFSVIPPPDELPGYDPSDSPLRQGGREDAPTPMPADSSLQGIAAAPHEARRVRVMFRVRREGWVSRRAEARSRFRTIIGSKGSSIPRILAGLDGRRGILLRARKNAVRSRFNLRGGRR